MVESCSRGKLFVVRSVLPFLTLSVVMQDQAFDRSHRFGQKRDVNIYKLKIDNTVEDRILEVSPSFSICNP